jgi:hypothetical protein
MSDEHPKTAESEAAREDVAAAAPAATDASPNADDPSRAAEPLPVATGERERVDEDGLPLDRPATLDDVRGNSGSGRVIAVGCTLLVTLVLALFWLIRAGLLG